MVSIFLEASIRQADKYIEKLVAIEELYNSLVDFYNAQGFRKDVIAFIFSKPIFTINKMKDKLKVSYNTARGYTQRLEETGRVCGDDKKRNRSYAFYDLIELL